MSSVFILRRRARVKVLRLATGHVVRTAPARGGRERVGPEPVFLLGGGAAAVAALAALGQRSVRETD